MFECGGREAWRMQLCGKSPSGSSPICTVLAPVLQPTFSVTNGTTRKVRGASYPLGITRSNGARNSWRYERGSEYRAIPIRCSLGWRNTGCRCIWSWAPCQQSLSPPSDRVVDSSRCMCVTASKAMYAHMFNPYSVESDLASLFGAPVHREQKRTEYTSRVFRKDFKSFFYVMRLKTSWSRRVDYKFTIRCVGLLLGCCVCLVVWFIRISPITRSFMAEYHLLDDRNPPSRRMGTHVIVELQQAPFELLNNSSRVRHALLAAANAGSLTVVGEHFHDFPIMGMSGMLLIRSGASDARQPAPFFEIALTLP